MNNKEVLTKEALTEIKGEELCNVIKRQYGALNKINHLM